MRRDEPPAGATTGDGAENERLTPAVADDDAQVPEASLRSFRLRAMPAALRLPAAMALLAIAGWSGALLLTALGYGVAFDPRRDGFGMMNDGALGAAVVRVSTVLGVGVAAIAATASATYSGWDDGRASRFGRRCVLVAVSAVGLILIYDVLSLSDIYAAGEPGTAARGRLIWCRTLGWSGVAAVAALPFFPYPSTFARKLSLGFTAFPFVSWIVASFVMGRLTAPWEANADWRGDVLQQTTVSLELVLVLFLVWEVVAWTELVAEGAAFAARRLFAQQHVVVGLLAAKVLWLGAGYAGLLPAALGGNAAAWRASAGDGPASWVTALILCVVLTKALASRRSLSTRVSEVPWRPVIIVLTALYLPGIVAGVLDALISPVFGLIPTGPLKAAALAAVLAGAAAAVLTTGFAELVEAPPERTLALAAGNACLVAGFIAAGFDLYPDIRALSTPAAGLAPPWVSPPLLAPGAIAAHYFLAPGAAFLVAVVLAVTARLSMRDGLREHEPRWLAPGAFALVLAAVALLHALPRLPQVPLQLDQEAVGATGDTLAPQFSYSVYRVVVPTWERWWEGPAGTFDLVTLDALLTVGICCLIWRWWRTDRGDWRVLSLVLVGTTVLAHSSTLAPDGWLGNRWYYLAFTVPIVWQFLLRGDELNRRTRRRPHLALLNLAVIVLLLSVLGYRLLIGALNPSLDFEDLVLGYTGGFTVDLVLLPLGILALARRLGGRVE